LGAANPVIAGKAIISAIPKTIGGKIGLTTAAGILATSQVAREKASSFIQDPTKIGREAGILIDKASKGQETGPVIDAFKTAGIIGGTAAILGTGAIVVKKVKEISADRAINIPSNVPSSIALPNSYIPTALDPLSDAPVISQTAKEPVASLQAPTPVSVKIINKPQINVAVAQSI